MNFLGMGTLEILVVLLLAFILLGPQRMIDVARFLGKFSRDIRRMTEGLPAIMMSELEADTSDTKQVDRPKGSRPTNVDGSQTQEGDAPGPVSSEPASTEQQPEDIASPDEEESNRRARNTPRA